MGKLMFVKWIDRKPLNPVSRQVLFVKFSGERKIICYIVDWETKVGNWCWSNAWDHSKGIRLTREELQKIEWLDEDYKSIPTSLEGCPFMYCDSNPECKQTCRYKR